MLQTKQKKTLSIGIILCTIVAVLNIGFTFAAWTTEKMTYNKVTANSVQGEIKEIYDQGQTIVPNVDIEKNVWVKNIGSADAFVRASIKYQFDDGTPLEEEDISFTLNSADWYDGEDGYYYYRRVLHPGEESTPLFESFKISGDLKNSEVGKTGRVIVHTDFVQAECDGLSYWNKTMKEIGIKYTPEPYEQKLLRVIFMGRNKGVQLPEGTDMFLSFKGLVPGTSRSQDIEVSNEADEPVYISLRAEVAGYDSTMTEIQRKQVDEMLQKYITIVITDNEGQEWYKGPIWGNLNGDGENRLESMRYDHDLGYFAPNEKKDLHISMTFSPDMPQYNNDLIGYVNWVFKITAFDDMVFTSPEPETGIGAMATAAIPFTATIGAGSALLLIFLLSKRKKNKSQG